MTRHALCALMSCTYPYADLTCDPGLDDNPYTNPNSKLNPHSNPKPDHKSSPNPTMRCGRSERVAQLLRGQVLG